MITDLHIKGFKSFVDCQLKLLPLTVLTGLNSSGKSSVIQAIRILDLIAKGKQPLLEGHGNLDELRSRYTSSMMIKEIIDGKSPISIDGTTKICDVTEDNLPRLTYIGADRLGASLTIPIYNDALYTIGPRGENALNCLKYFSDTPLDSRLKPENGEGLTLEYMVAGWLRYISPGVTFDYKIEEKADLSYCTFDGNRSANVGFGLSYTLPIIIALLLSTKEENNVVLIENPEAHLHPKGQTEMGRLIGLCALCGSQIIVETHSDHLFDGIRLFTKHTEGFNENLVAYWFESHGEQGTSATPIKIDHKGRFLETCPAGFFDQFETNASELLF